MSSAARPPSPSPPQSPTRSIPSTVDEEYEGDDKTPCDPIAMFEHYQIRMGDGWTIGDRTFERQPIHKRRRIDAPYPRMINHTYRALSGLNGLQIGNETPINLAAMDIACEHVWKSLHDNVRQHVIVPPPNGPSLWSGNEKDINEIYRKMELPEHRDMDKEYRFYPEIKKHPWIIWPLWVEDDYGKDYITVLIYSQPHEHDVHRLQKGGTRTYHGALRTDSHCSPQPPIFTQVVAYTIIDPRRSIYGTGKPGADKDTRPRCDFPKTRTRRVEDALRDLLQHAGYDLSLVPLRRTKRCGKTGAIVPLTEDEIESPMTITHCSAMRWQDCTSAERCFATVKELLERIVPWHLAADKYKAPLAVFSHLRQWVNPYQFRVEMTGICAWALMGTLDYDARIVVERIPDEDIPVVQDGERRRLPPHELVGPENQPPLAEPDWTFQSDFRSIV
ncbi:hypothetical protein SLS62_005041 [Diatrype stigma]|uniref:Uncharacterized protein n=1 Tax=Diatrype stigma TaxID=117547 RepID=A0AAN9UTH3_9PEZI